jgi:lanosterol synthase
MCFQTGIKHKTSSTPLEAAINGFEFMKEIQAPDGHWPGVCGGQMYLVPMYVISLYLCGTKPKPEEAVEMIRYMLNRAHPVDGGWGL